MEQILQFISSIVAGQQEDAQRLIGQWTEKLTAFDELDLVPLMAQLRSKLPVLLPVIQLIGDGVRMQHDFRSREIKRLVRGGATETTAIAVVTAVTRDLQSVSMSKQ